MRRDTTLSLIVLLAGAILGGPVTGQEGQPPSEPAVQSAIDVLARFAGSLELLAPDGTRRTVHVTVQNWGIVNGRTVDQFPASGLLLMELRGGEVTTVINNGMEEREVGAFWIVPAGASLSITTGDDTASLQVVAIQRDEIR